MSFINYNGVMRKIDNYGYIGNVTKYLTHVKMKGAARVGNSATRRNGRQIMRREGKETNKIKGDMVRKGGRPRKRT